MKPLFKRCLTWAALSLAVLTSTQAQTFPDNKPVTMVVPFAAGGPTDVVARMLAIPMGKALNTTVTVENTVGAGGTIASARVARAAPTGHTIYLHHMGMATAVALYRKLSFDPLKDFEYIGQVVDVPMTMLARKDFPANNLQDLIRMTKQSGKPLAYATAGVGTSSHLAAEYLFNTLAGIPANHIPFKGGAPATTAVLGNQVELLSASLGGALPFIKQGKMKALALSPKRADVAPGVPGLRESGIGFDFNTWWGWFAPAGLPREITRRMNAEIAKLIAEPQFHAKFIASQGLATDHPTGASPEEFEKFIRADQEEFARLVKMVGIKPQ